MSALKTTPQIAVALRKKTEFYSKRGRKYEPKIPRILHPVHVERRYILALRKSFTKLFKLISMRLLPTLPALLDKTARELAPQRFDSADDDLRLILDSILVEFGRELTQTEIQAIAKRRGLEVSEFNRLQNGKVFKKLLDVDIFRDELWLETALQNFATDNAALITTLSQKHIAEVRSLVINGMRQGVTAKELAQQIQSRVTGKTRANFNLIARDQVSKLNGQLTMLRQRDLGVTRYVWRTSLDERVRASHRAHRDKVYFWDNPPEDTGHPGNDYQCRCYAEPVLEDLIE